MIGQVIQLLSVHLSVDALGRVRHGSESLLGDQLSGIYTNAISTVFDSYQGIFQVIDELLLPSGKLA